MNERIDWYLQAANPVELYGKVIQRWEQDYGQPDPACENIVRESLIRLWAARRGLSETELLESMGTPGSPLPRAIWSPLYLAAGDALVNRGGLLTFAHDFLCEAVREMYLPTEVHERAAHRTLAAYFEPQPQGLRQLDELPWQWQGAAEWQKLADLLAQPSFFDALWDKSEFEVRAYWTRIEVESLLRMEQAYAATIERPTHDAHHAWLIGNLLDKTGKPEAAFRIRTSLAESFRAQNDRGNLLRALSGQANILYYRGELDDAQRLFEETERLCRELGNKDGLAGSLNAQGLILYSRGDLDGAMVLLKEDEVLCRESGNKRSLRIALNSQAMLLDVRGDWDGAIALHKESESLCRELGDKEGLAQSMNNQAVILTRRGDMNTALTLLEESERTDRELGSKRGLMISLAGVAKIHHLRGELDSAMLSYQEVECLSRELGARGEVGGARERSAHPSGPRGL